MPEAELPTSQISIGPNSAILKERLQAVKKKWNFVQFFRKFVGVIFKISILIAIVFLFYLALEPPTSYLQLRHDEKTSQKEIKELGNFESIFNQQPKLTLSTKEINEFISKKFDLFRSKNKNEFLNESILFSIKNEHVFSLFYVLDFSVLKHAIVFATDWELKKGASESFFLKQKSFSIGKLELPEPTWKLSYLFLRRISEAFLNEIDILKNSKDILFKKDSIEIRLSDKKK
ncbi:MAG: hypothetical protein N2035_00475 [Chthoniobacterales bacterium]|nr:hypothetical protein [Chthoniobacterales bacterium]MCX7712133.1 hypothetical protein [Chthoniobacterales bacterium]